MQNLCFALPPEPQWPLVALPHTPDTQFPIADFWLCTWLEAVMQIAKALHQNFYSITSAKM